MTDYGHDLLFGAFITPAAEPAETAIDLARAADRLGFDLLGIQDHPYQPRFLDTWTLLSALARETERVRLVPDVINLPLRPPAVLARAAASLDLLSGGRVELGLGAGAFFDAIASMGGPSLSPGEATDALAEAIQVIRALWTPGQAVTFEGRYYQLRGARPGPIPAHRIGVWLGSYKPRMLRLTGQLADGWIPTSAYAAPDALAEMSRQIDEAARAAGREPSTIRRVYNISGNFSAGREGFLEGPSRLWIEQLSELVHEFGFSGFLLAPGSEPLEDLRRFAEEVAPGVREMVEAQRAGAGADTAKRSHPAPVSVDTAPVAGARHHHPPSSPLLDENARPHAVPLDLAATAVGRQSQETLLAVHEHLRQELAQILSMAAQVAQGRLDPAAARSLINQMTLRQNYWTFGAFCAQYCRIVTVHHTIEDRFMFPALHGESSALDPVLDRLHWEHEVIAEVIEELDRALVAMIEDPERVAEVRRVADALNDALLSHLAYEENELLGPLGASSIAV